MCSRASLELRAQQRVLRLLAKIVRDLLEVGPLGQRLHAPGHGDRLVPILLLFVDLQKKAQ